MKRLTSCLLITLAAGMLEASLLVDWHHQAAVRFILRYALQQLLVSVVWCTQDALLVCQSMGLETLLLDFEAMELTEKSSRLLAIGQCHAVRSVSAGFGLLGQLFQFTQITNNTFKHFEAKVRAGQELPLSSGDDERVIRLCGDFSYATYATASKNGRFHILPVMDPNSMPMLASQMTCDFKFPLFLHVPMKLWGQPQVWEASLGEAVRPSWLLRGAAGHRVLCLEVDGTERQEILLFGRARKVGIEQASNAFRAMSLVLRRRLKDVDFQLLLSFT